ncbi:MAG: TonB-dependent receptor [Proteobacteria bacterium]|nr:TonB-dependent receptor [Pseudomonadota bacterium]
MTKKKLALVLTSSFLSSLAGGMVANSALAADSLALEEVIVTARKRAESLQDIPMAITAFTAADIQEAGIRNIQDVASLTAGFNMSPLFGGDAAVPVIRGLSTTIGEPNVGFFIDGVYTGSRLTMNRLLGNFVERIEVAKGPQSALYGRNAFGGAVNYVTRRAGEEFEGEVEATFGSDGKQEFRASIGGPIGDSGLGYRIGLLSDEFDGYFKNELTGGDLDSRDTKGVLGTLSWSGDSLNIDFNLMYNEEDNGDQANRQVQDNDLFGSFRGLPPANQMYNGNLPSFDDGFAVTPGGLDREQTFSSLKFDWDFGAATLTSITGYNDFSHVRTVDDDYSAREIHTVITDNDVTELSQEFRLTGNTQSSLQWMIGVYYYDLSDDIDLTSKYDDSIPAVHPLLASSNTLTNQNTDDIAVFGSLDWFITEELTLGFSGRYGKESKDVDVLVTDTNTGATGTFSADDDWTSFQPRVSLDWQFSDNHMTYVSYAFAEKSGGFNVVTTTGAILPEERFYDPETSDNYEIGLKSTFADGRVQTTLAAYYIKWEDQIVRAIGETGAVLNINAGESTSKGIEFEMQAQLSQNWDLGMSVAYNDAQYDDYFFAILGEIGIDPQLKGTTLQYTPEWTGNLSLGYTLPVFGDWEWVSRFDVDYIDDQTAVQSGNAIIESVTKMNLRTSLRNDHWMLTLWSYNLTDEKYTASAAFIRDPSIVPDVFFQGGGFSAFNPLITAGEPLSYGATIQYSF